VARRSAATASIDFTLGIAPPECASSASSESPPTARRSASSSLSVVRSAKKILRAAFKRPARALPAINPAAEWLLGYGLPYNTGLQDDPDGDGLSLLIAYALNLDPNLNLRGNLPVPVLGPQGLSLSFHGIRPGI